MDGPSGVVSTVADRRSRGDWLTAIPRRLLCAMAITWTVLILIGTLMPRRSMSGIDEKSGFFLEIPYFDKIVHFSMFAGFGLLWGLTLSGLRGRFWWVLVTGLALGALTELGQTLPIINRDGGWDDMAADALGIGVAMVALMVVGRRRG